MAEIEMFEKNAKYDKKRQNQKCFHQAKGWSNISNVFIKPKVGVVSVMSGCSQKEKLGRYGHVLRVPPDRTTRGKKLYHQTGQHIK